MAMADFREIAHCGGQFTVTTKTDEQGGRRYSLGFRGSRPVPMLLFGVYALPEGIPVGMIELGGIGLPFNQPPFPNSLSIFVASDSEGRVGHECPECKGYWRSGGATIRWPITCPYCGLRGSAHQFLTAGQRKYIRACCDLIMEAMSTETDGEKAIDMDAAVDAALMKSETPKFYYAEQSQQTRFTCAACGEWNDVLGRFAFCSSCGTRNDLAQVEALISSVRSKINTESEDDLRACVRDLVSAFDTMTQQYASQLITHVPLTQGRRAMFERRRFHDLRRSSEDFTAAFDINILEGLDEGDVKFGVMMFERRHVYEHKGGEADEKYIEKSGDSSVRPKQIIRETRENAHRLATIVARLCRNLHEGFHELIPAENAPIELKRDMNRYRQPAR